MRSPIPFAFVLAALALTPRAVRADDEGKTRALGQVKEGNALYEAKRYPEAVDAFRSAFASYPSPKILFNLGQCFSSMGRKADAAQSYEQFMEMAKSDPQLSKSEFARRAQERLNQLSPSLGRIVFQVDPSDAAHEVDGSLAPTQVVYVEPGAHVAGASKAGYSSQQLHIVVAKGSEAAVGLVLEPTPAVAVPSTAAAPVAEAQRTEPPPQLQPGPAAAPTGPLAPAVSQAEAPRPSRMPALLTTIGAGLLGAGSLTMGLVAMNQYQHLPNNPLPYAGPSSLSPAEQSELLNARISDGLLVGTVIVGAVATYLWLSGPHSQSP